MRVLSSRTATTIIILGTDNGEDKDDGVVAHVPQLRVFNDVAGYCGVCVYMLCVCVCVRVCVCCVYICRVCMVLQCVCMFHYNNNNNNNPPIYVLPYLVIRCLYVGHTLTGCS